MARRRGDRHHRRYQPPTNQHDCSSYIQQYFMHNSYHLYSIILRQSLLPKL
nr:hypothetical protein I308_06575 [Cryptococcus tetragattii IND107]